VFWAVTGGTPRGVLTGAFLDPGAGAYAPDPVGSWRPPRPTKVTLSDARGRTAAAWRIIGSRRVRVPAPADTSHHQGATAVPTYEYACTNPEGKHEFEVVQSFSDAPISVCPECGAPVRKVYGSVGVVFKGSGFYRTDSRKSATASDGASSAKESSSSSSSSSSKESSSSTTSSTPAPSTSGSGGSKAAS